MSGVTNRKLDVLVVGGTASLAIPIMELLSSSGFNLQATFRNPPKDKGQSTNWLHLDVARQDSILEFLNQIDRQQFDFILMFIGSPFRAGDAASDYVETYLTNMVFLCQALSLRLRSNVNSAMLHVSSRSSIYPSRDVLYSAVKGGLNSALRSLSRGLPEKSKIVSVAPGLVLQSAMAKDMASEIVADHILRSSNQLLDLNGFATEFLGLMSKIESIESGSIVELGPGYS
jgi:NAD(P)-dependent dehydrogenase (short-subunit alcohol dehydrogenase family)